MTDKKNGSLPGKGTPENDGKATTTKIETMLWLFLLGRSFNRFDAEHHHDHCLHSTVSTLQNGYGIKIERMSENVPCLGGASTVRVKRYWLNPSPDNLAAARALLAMWRRVA